METGSLLTLHEASTDSTLGWQFVSFTAKPQEEGMSLNVFIAHTGERYTPEASVSSLDALRIWIQQCADVHPQNQILMTGRGKNVKPQSLLTENEIFVYDRRFITPPSNDGQHLEFPPLPPPPPFSAGSPPSDRSVKHDLPSWRDLFQARRQWSEDVRAQVQKLHTTAKKAEEQSAVIGRAAAVAMDNLKSHVTNIQNLKFPETRNWAQEMLKSQDSTLSNWQDTAESFRAVAIYHDFSFLLQRPPTPTRREPHRGGPVGNLYGLVDVHGVKDAASHAAAALDRFRRQLAQVEKAIQTLRSDTEAVDGEFHEQTRHLASSQEGEVDGLLEEVKVLAKKVISDHAYLTQTPTSSKALADASRMAHAHAKDLLPALTQLGEEAGKAAQAAVERRNSLLQAALVHLQNVSIIQSGLPGVQAQVQQLDLEPSGSDAFCVLDTVFRLPVVYGSLLIEAIRRHEWDEKLAAESSALVEDLTPSQDEEEKRRKKWAKSVAGFVRNDQTLAASLHVGLRDIDERWPSISRHDVAQYMKDLQAENIHEPVAELDQMVQDLDAAPKQKRRLHPPFKNGSVYDAGLNRSSMLRSVDETTRTLRDDKARLEEKLKSSESRVRKLEDLMHRQGAMSRPVSGNFTVNLLTDLDRTASSPLGYAPARPDLASRRSSVSSRRLSSNHNLEEKHLVHRIVSLEADLVAEREIVARLQREAHTERRSSSDVRDQMEEAVSTKKDLLANLESLQSEFEEERQLLEDESHKLKVRLEEAEEEIDRLLGSRDHEKLTADRAIQSLQNDVSQLRRGLEDQQSQAEGQIDLFRHDLLKQQERAEGLETQLSRSHEEHASVQSKCDDLQSQLREQETAHAKHRNALEGAHTLLSPEGAPPTDFGKLVQAIEILAEGLAIHARSSEDAASRAHAENKSLEERLAQAEEESHRLQAAEHAHETEMLALKEATASYQRQSDAVRSELADEQAELEKLRSKFAAGETGSDVLRERVALEERRAADLSEQLAISKSHADSFEQEIAIWRQKVMTLEETERQARGHGAARGDKAQLLSRRLVAQHDLFVRLLEHMGFVLVLDGSHHQVQIQRASKISASTNLGSSMDASIPMNRTLSGAAPPQHYSSSSELETLYWLESDPEREDVKFDAFLAAVSRLDLENATDMVTKRYKDVETLAKKFQRDSRAYREKSHRAQAEAHEKIAYRSFKDGDLALFLPTRNQATRPWAAFNVGAPHYFLREQDGHKLPSRDWLLARISRVEERVVDLSRSMAHHAGNLDRVEAGRASEASEAGSTRSVDDDNPFELSDGLRWYMIDAAEEKPGAPSTPGMGKSTVASSKVDATGSVRLTPGDAKRARDSSGGGSAAVATKTLSKSLDSRRSSSASKKDPKIPTLSAGHAPLAREAVQDSSRPTSSSAQPGPTVNPVQVVKGDDQAVREDDPIFEEGAEDERRQNLLHSALQSPSPNIINPKISSPSKTMASPEKKKGGWSRIWSVDYRFEETRK